MKRPMTEVEKNFMQCAAIMVACALVFLLILKWLIVGIVVSVFAVVSLGIGLWMFLFTEGYKDEDKKPSYLEDQRKLGQ